MQTGGAARLEAVLAGEAEEATPEFLRQRPKYYYYNQWMRQRIAEACGAGLPEPVVGRLLAMEAGELDLILHYPRAARQQVPGPGHCHTAACSTQSSFRCDTVL